MRHHASTPPTSKRILLCQTVPTRPLENKIIRGVRRFALNRPAWEIGIINPVDIVQDLDKILNQWKPDGILVVSRPTSLSPLFVLPDTPIVVVDHRKECPDTVTRLLIDDEGVGGRAADFFLRKRFRHTAVVTQQRKSPFSECRKRGFTQRLATEGIEPACFEMESKFYHPWDRNPDLEAWLTSLPTPIGIFCVMDVFAQQILEHAKHFGLRIPGDVSILGVGDNREICEVVRPTLSSIHERFEACGFRAAEVLDDQMQIWASGEPPPIRYEAIPMGEVVERQSTSLAAIPDPAVAKAVHYLQTQTLLGGTITEAAKVSGINRRAMERGFRRHLGVSPGQYMTEVKLDHAKVLLSQTDLRMGEIAEACRMTQDHFSYLIRTTTGQTPSAYRRSSKRFSTIPQEHT